jgi:hypothetical protein
LAVPDFKCRNFAVLCTIFETLSIHSKSFLGPIEVPFFKMHALWSVVYAFAFASFANAQGNLGGPQPNCLESQPYKYIGCFDLTNIAESLHNGYDLAITGHDFNQYPNNTEIYTYYAGPPGWSDPNSPHIFSYYEASMNPKNCTTACRGHGYRFAGLSNNQCVCGAYPPSVAVDIPQDLDPLSLTSACHDFSLTGGCQGDKSQQCRLRLLV